MEIDYCGNRDNAVNSSTKRSTRVTRNKDWN